VEAAERAARLEREFIEAFERNLRSFRWFSDPRDGKLYSVKKARFERRNRAKALTIALRKQGPLRRRDLLSYPISPVVSVKFKRPLSTRSFLIVAASLTAFEPYLQGREKEAERPLGAEAIREFFNKNKLPSGAFAVYGFFSASGWQEGALQGLGQGNRICLVAPEAEGLWKVIQQLGEKVRQYRWLFDPEGKEGRVERLCKEISSLWELSVPGGFLPIDKLCASFNMDEELAHLVLKSLTERDPELCIEDVEGVRILKRRRA